MVLNKKNVYQQRIFMKFFEFGLLLNKKKNDTANKQIKCTKHIESFQVCTNSKMDITGPKESLYLMC